MFKRTLRTYKNPILLSNYPVGILLYSEDSYEYYLTTARGLLQFLTKKMAKSWNLPEVRLSNILDLHPVGKVGFRDGTLIKNVEDGKLYLISGSKRRQITNPEWLPRLGLTKSDILWANKEEVELHGRGDDLV